MEQEHQNGTGRGDSDRGTNGPEADPAAEAGHAKNNERIQTIIPDESNSQPTVASAAFDFIFEGRTVRTVLWNGETWFVVNDVCGILEHSNPRVAVSRLDDDEKGVTIVYTLGGPQAMNVVSESGLYSLIYTSQMPRAQAFRRWINREVLPAIRKTGRYEAPTEKAVPGVPFGAGEVTLTLPNLGRYTITMRPGRQPDIVRSDYASALTDYHLVDLQLLCSQLNMIEAFWHKWRTIDCLGTGSPDGFALTGLEETILQGGRYAKQLLAVSELRQRRQTDKPAT